MNARHIWSHLFTQLHTHLITLVKRTQVRMERMGTSMDTREGKVETALLQYQSDMEAIVLAETHEGKLIGSGDGSVSGDLFNGNVRWSMYVGNCAYVLVRAGLESPAGQHLCMVHPAGIIETSDGAKVWSDARGYGLGGG